MAATYSQNVFDLAHGQLLEKHVEFGAALGPKLGFARGRVVDAVCRAFGFGLDQVMYSFGPLNLNMSTRLNLRRRPGEWRAVRCRHKLVRYSFLPGSRAQ